MCRHHEDGKRLAVLSASAIDRQSAKQVAPLPLIPA
jgi:hypothetical protein